MHPVAGFAARPPIAPFRPTPPSPYPPARRCQTSASSTRSDWVTTSTGFTGRPGVCAARAKRPRISCRRPWRGCCGARDCCAQTMISPICCGRCATRSSALGAPPHGVSRPRPWAMTLSASPTLPRSNWTRGLTPTACTPRSPNCQPDFRDVLVAIDLVGLSYREAARALRVREATVTTRLHRARKRLGVALSEETAPPSGGRPSEPR